MRYFFLILFVALPRPLFATTLHVPSQYPTIQSGLDAASLGDSVLVACGTYYEHDILMKSGIVLLSESGTTDSSCVTINAQQLGRVFYCMNVDNTTTIEGFIITGGVTDDGAGLVCYDSSPTLVGCTFTGNEAWDWGAGMACYQGCSPTIMNCTFFGNQAPYGAGMACWDYDPTPAKIIDCVFTRNTAEWAGGAMDCPHSSPLIVNCVFSENSAGGCGGGISCWQGSSPTLTNCSFSGNWADWGGGMVCEHDSAPTLTGCSFFGNSANRGGGLDCRDHSSAIIMECTFVANSAPRGGGVRCYYSSHSRFTNCTFSGNSAQICGGGLYCQRSSSPTLENTIIAFSMEGEAVCCDYTSGATLTCCDVYGNQGGDWVGYIEPQFGIEGNISEDPLFCGEANPETPYTLQSDSPCAPFSPPNPECGLIGAWPVGCDPSAVDDHLLVWENLHLAPNVPNPFGSTTRINYRIPCEAGSTPVILCIYDSAGRLVRNLVEAPQPAGTHTVSWDGRDDKGRTVQGGIYFCQLRHSERTGTRRMLSIR
ncbi:MAG: right-handed parallel beta-helix repeat-containing protein [Candidatus Eisenbacteria sp.]|nr:right-handed parallel beta-helix repeat-containing protein [Candidatus Eisenbacteria bacterium]